MKTYRKSNKGVVSNYGRGEGLEMGGMKYFGEL